MYKKFKDFDLRNLFSIFVKKLNYVLIFKTNYKRNRRETKDAVSILLIPEELKSKYAFIAGQYLNLRLTLDGEEIRRAYSICSSRKW
jgi:ring-1,2-phenylacetyl-CoA epoxidase subunit PaaE